MKDIQILGDPLDFFRVFVDEKDILVFFREFLGNVIPYLTRTDNDDFHWFYLPFRGRTPSMTWRIHTDGQ